MTDHKTGTREEWLAARLFRGRSQLLVYHFMFGHGANFSGGRQRSGNPGGVCSFPLQRRRLPRYSIARVRVQPDTWMRAMP
jgi:hypothetical protein